MALTRRNDIGMSIVRALMQYPVIISGYGQQKNNCHQRREREQPQKCQFGNTQGFFDRFHRIVGIGENHFGL